MLTLDLLFFADCECAVTCRVNFSVKTSASSKTCISVEFDISVKFSHQVTYPHQVCIIVLESLEEAVRRRHQNVAAAQKRQLTVDGLKRRRQRIHSQGLPNRIRPQWNHTTTPSYERLLKRVEHITESYVLKLLLGRETLDLAVRKQSRLPIRRKNDNQWLREKLSNYASLSNKPRTPVASGRAS